MTSAVDCTGQDAEREAAAQRNAKRMTAPKSFPRVAMDLATTVERIQQNFTISDPSLPDCPIVFASDSFLELTQYPRHEVWALVTPVFAVRSPTHSGLDASGAGAALPIPPFLPHPALDLLEKLLLNLLVPTLWLHPTGKPVAKNLGD